MPCGSPVPLAAPASTVPRLMVLPFFCGSASRVCPRPTPGGPGFCSPGLSIASSLRPGAVRRAASCSVVTSAGRSTYSRIQETGAFIGGHRGSARRRRAATRSRGFVRWSQVGPEHRGEADVALEQRAQVLDAVAEHESPVDAHAEGEAGELLGVDATGVQDPWVDDPAAAPLDPAFALAGAAALAVHPATDEAHEVDLGAG